MQYTLQFHMGTKMFLPSYFHYHDQFQKLFPPSALPPVLILNCILTCCFMYTFVTVSCVYMTPTDTFISLLYVLLYLYFTYVYVHTIYHTFVYVNIIFIFFLYHHLKKVCYTADGGIKNDHRRKNTLFQNFS